MSSSLMPVSVRGRRPPIKAPMLKAAHGCNTPDGLCIPKVSRIPGFIHTYGTDLPHTHPMLSLDDLHHPLMVCTVQVPGIYTLFENS